MLGLGSCASCWLGRSVSVRCPFCEHDYADTAHPFARKHAASITAKQCSALYPDGVSPPERVQASGDSQEVESTSSLVPADSSLVPVEPEVLLLDDTFSQCTWIRPVAMPGGSPEQLALPPPPLTLQTGPEPDFGDEAQTEALQSPPQPPPEVNQTTFIVHDGGIKETERTNVAAAQDGARLLFSNPCVTILQC